MTATETEVKPVSPDQMALKVATLSSRRYLTYTALFAAFFYIVGGFSVILETLPKPIQTGLVPTALIDLGVLFSGLFLGFGVMHTLLRRLYYLNHPEALPKKKVKK